MLGVRIEIFHFEICRLFVVAFSLFLRLLNEASVIECGVSPTCIVPFLYKCDFHVENPDHDKSSSKDNLKL